MVLVIAEVDLDYMPTSPGSGSSSRAHISLYLSSLGDARSPWPVTLLGSGMEDWEDVAAAHAGGAWRSLGGGAVWRGRGGRSCVGNLYGLWIEKGRNLYLYLLRS